MKFYDGKRLPNAGNIVMPENCIVILYQIISKETELPHSYMMQLTS